MNSYLKLVILTASLALAITFTLSCSSDDPEPSTVNCQVTGGNCISNLSVEQCLPIGTVVASCSNEISSGSGNEAGFCLYRGNCTPGVYRSTCESNGGTFGKNSCPTSGGGSSSPSGNSSSSVNNVPAPSSSSKAPSPYVGNSGTFTDSRDNTNYKWVRIGTQVWMAENLNYTPTVGKSQCYDGAGNTSNCNKFGRQYDWSAAMNRSNVNVTLVSPSDPYKGACPDGWYLPKTSDWSTLLNFVGGAATAGTKLKAKSEWTNMSDIIPGTDDYGFSALPGGQAVISGDRVVSSAKGTGGYWWTVTESTTGVNAAWNLGMVVNKANAEFKEVLKAFHYSIRCVTD